MKIMQNPIRNTAINALAYIPIMFPVLNFFFIGYILYVLENCLDILEDPQDDLPQVLRKWKLSTTPVKISNNTAAEMLYGRCDLSQRGFKYLRHLLKESNVELPTYEKVRSHNLNLDVGEIEPIHRHDNCDCFGYKSSLSETLSKIISNQSLFKLFKFISFEKQTKVFEYLREQDINLYGNLNSNLRTFSLEQLVTTLDLLQGCQLNKVHSQF